MHLRLAYVHKHAHFHTLKCTHATDNAPPVKEAMCILSGAPILYSVTLLCWQLNLQVDRLHSWAYR